MRLSVAERIWSGVLCAGCLAVLCFAGWLSVGQAEDGTLQRSSGIPPCGFHAATGKPCATCGMTRSFALVSAGRVQAAATLQPAGTTLAFLTGCVVWLSGIGAVSGSRLGVAAANGIGVRGVWFGLSVLAAGWVYTLLSWGG